MDRERVELAVEDLDDTYFWGLKWDNDLDFRTLKAAKKTIQRRGADHLIGDLGQTRHILEAGRAIVENLLRFLNDRPHQQVLSSTDFAEDTIEWRILRDVEDGVEEDSDTEMRDLVLLRLSHPDRVVDRPKLIRAIGTFHGDLWHVLKGQAALLVLSRLVRADEMAAALVGA